MIKTVHKYTSTQVHGKEKGFTYIELLIALIIIGVCLIPVMRMFSTSLEQENATDDIMTALMVGRINMESLKNLNFTKSQILEIGRIYNPPLEEPALELNKMKWRALREPIKGTDPLEIHIKVFKADKLDKSVLEFVTLYEDLEWTSTE